MRNGGLTGALGLIRPPPRNREFSPIGTVTKTNAFGAVEARSIGLRQHLTACGSRVDTIEWALEVHRVGCTFPA